jgi:sortase A
MGINGTRTLGTVLMGIGLIVILSVGGYFAWTEVQAAQVRTELEQSSATAAARATRMAEELGQATPSTGGAPLRTPTDRSRLVAAAKTAPSAAHAPDLQKSASTPADEQARSAPPATRAPSATAKVTSSTETPAPTPTSAVAATPADSPTMSAAPVLPVRLVIPDLKIDTAVVEMGWDVVQTKNGPVSEWAIPKSAAGHHVNSASIGRPDNLVISGHNNIYGRVFMPISQAWTNDGMVKVDSFTDRSHVLDGREVLLFDAAGNQHSYVITAFYRLRDSGVSQQQREINGRFILPKGDERVTIVTCWPPTNNTHRLVVIARPDK